jgi:predicted RNA binding protein YcfA (HicA-like mRNA interferase family)
LRRSQPKATEIINLAKQLGRRKAKRGDHITYVSDTFSQLRPLSIPMHKGRDLPNGTKGSILNQLEEDLDAWSDALDTKGKGNGRDQYGE